MDLLLVLVSEHYKLEENYGRELKKILKKVEELQEIGTVQKVWEGVKAEMDKIAMSHINMANQLRAAVYGPIETFAKEQKETRKTQLIEVKELMREYNHLHTNITRAKGKYDQRCLEAVNTEKQLEQSKSKSAPKQKLQKVQKDQQTAEQEYQATVQKLASYQPTWETKLSQLVDSLQMLEETRMEMVQHSLEKYIDAQKPLEKQISESHEAVAEKLRTVNIDTDMEEWIGANRTGTTPPPVPVFLPFNPDNIATIPTGTSSPSLSSSNPSLSRNTSDRSLSVRDSNTNSAPPSPSVPHSIANPPPVPTRNRSQTNSLETSGSTSNTNTTPPKAANRKTPDPSRSLPVNSPLKGIDEDSIAQTEDYQEEIQDENQEFETVVAQYEYIGNEPNELVMREGDRITVLQKHDSGWWMGQSVDGKTGMFPSNYTVPEGDYVP
jgi:hypothetical protein